jgi:hypothetical protein
VVAAISGFGSHLVYDPGALGRLVTLLARLSASPDTARSAAAMRQAWWRWTTTTDGGGAGTPPVIELVRIARYAGARGWLSGLTDPRVLYLRERFAGIRDPGSLALAAMRPALGTNTHSRSTMTCSSSSSSSNGYHEQLADVAFASVITVGSFGFGGV